MENIEVIPMDMDKLRKSVKENSHTLYAFSAEDLIKEWEYKTGKKHAELVTDKIKSASGYVSPFMDSIVASKLIKDLGFFGKVVTTIKGGKSYIVFKGLAGKRTIFTSTRYLANNAKVVDMAIGKLGLNKSILGGLRLTIYLTIPINILLEFTRDHFSMTRLLGTTATDVIKLMAAAGASVIASMAVGSITAVAAGPLIAAIAVGIATGYILSELDEHFGITEALIEFMDKSVDRTFGEVVRQLLSIERLLTYQAVSGQRVGRGLFY
jgi:hypothetical protein